MTGSRSSYLVGKAFRSFLLASVLTAAASQVGTLVDGIMLSHFINESAMSAINISSPVMQALFAICILIGTGGSMLAGVEMGNHRREEASNIFSMVLSAIVLVGLAVLALGLFFFDPLMELLCPDISLRPYAASYLEIIIPAAPIYMVMTVVQMFVTLDGEPRRVTGAVVVCTLVNLCLDYVFIVWCGWGMSGAASATVISYVAALLVLSSHFMKKDTLSFVIPESIRIIGRIASMGLPFGIATVLIAVQLLGNNTVAMNYLGGEGIVTLSICMYLLQFSMIILTGTLESFQPVAAILKGSGDNRGVALVLRNAYGFLAAGVSVLALILILFPQWIISFFGIVDPDSIKMLHVALPAFAANIILQCSVYLLIPVYQIYEHKMLALVISLGQPLLPMVFFWIFSSLFAHGASWINPWWGFAVGQICVVLILLPFALSRKGDHLPFFLIPADRPKRLFDISVKPSVDRMMQSLEEADLWLKERGVDDATRVRIVLACEESVGNVIKHALARRHRSMIDMRIAIADDNIMVVIRDDGSPFNPVKQDPRTGLGLLIIKKACDDMRYEYLFNQNLLTMVWYNKNH